jgi:hypothetical protein
MADGLRSRQEHRRGECRTAVPFGSEVQQHGQDGRCEQAAHYLAAIMV